MRVAITNDDGIHANGLLVLARTFYDAGHDVIIVAPLEEASGSSAGTGAWRGATSRIVPFESVALDLSSSVPAFGLAALPAMCVAITLTGCFGPSPDCVVSGINRGRNVGGSVLHSGTLGAALTAVNLGTAGLSISVEARREEPHYETAAVLALELVDLACALPKGHALNVNVADRPLDQLRGVQVAHIGSNPIIYGATLEQDAIHLVRGLRHATKFEENTDESLTNDGFATVTVIRPPVEHSDEATSAAVQSALARVKDHLGLKGKHPSFDAGRGGS